MPYGARRTSRGAEMLKLDQLLADTQVAGIEPSGPVKVLYVKTAGRLRSAPQGDQ